MWTKKAAAFLAFGVGAFMFAVMTGSLGLAAIGLVFSLPVVVAYMLQRRVRLDSQRDVSADRVREDDQVQVRLLLRGAGMGTGFIEVRDRLDARLEVRAGSNYRVLSLPRGKEMGMDYEIHTPIRGVYPIGPLQVRKTDTFELFFSVYEVPDSSDGLTVLPRSELLKEAKIKSLTPKILSGANPVRQPGIGSQFYALREYTSADPMKDVNWKASARAGELIVNQWERESISVITMIFDARKASGAGTLGANPVLYNARAAATLAELFIGERDTLRFVHYDDDVHILQPDSGERQMFKILQKLADIEPKGAMTLDEVVHHLLPHLASRSPVVIFTSLEEDDTVIDGVSNLLARDLNVMLIVPSAPDFLRKTDDGDLDSTEYKLRRIRHQMEVKRLRGLGAKVVLWEPDDRLEMAFMGSIYE